MRTTSSSDSGGEETTRSRFSYFGDEPEIGGVTSARSSDEKEKEKPAKPTVRGNRDSRMATRRPENSGAPGPEERLLDISELVRNVGMRYTHKFRIPPHEIPEFDTAAPVEGEITLTNTGDVLLLRGNAATVLPMECVRCLEMTEQKVEADLEENFPLVSSNTAYQQDEVSAVDEDETAAVISQNVLDLGDLLRQYLLLAAPLQPLCKENCVGLPEFAGLTLTEGGLPDAEAEAVPVNPNNPLRNLAALLEAQSAEGSEDDNEGDSENRTPR
ncbi:MAG: hypothetical protein OHK0029_21500 [Armatimonadaceae bacterium]